MFSLHPGMQKEIPEQHVYFVSEVIMLVEVRFAAIHNSNIRWVSLKIKLYEVGSIPYTKPNPKPPRKC